ncbi:MAG: hypothetical protein A2Y45_06115 [Tenericutes bacterium GWC2_34_14]|nr:MAG: hypothetical protein A2Z84_04110 [Tenericutes bacterium GWA2_35_7]OHE28530.1 MAG: hypothetical protein A2Y45_06115 [Tenericutes bacterium GWC2_34_14]OHE33562.1 MAG: hypothetical protein A2012_03695 [Tenericutes bacterium GWE2_34_108]OHE36847.1 MAG: hypothetical protein A2Y46_09495 [Tenericutes bacterium GWF1_35_14]OHE38073.1 MAG: hypothetical protein A2Y44_09170 [Tenericutes bacterium GWF2_35_184]OHE42096.1 MAG: hypothetical protein A3K26_07995 [Tenericutes bacterium RIFOXYA12_FULL_35_
MFHLSDLFEPFLEVFKGLSFQSHHTLKDYVIPILKKLGAFLVLTVIMFFVVILMMLGLDALLNEENTNLILRLVSILFLIGTIPSLIDSIRTYRIQKDKIYLYSILIMSILILILGLALYTEGVQLLSGLLIES